MCHFLQRSYIRSSVCYAWLVLLLCNQFLQSCYFSLIITTFLFKLPHNFNNISAFLLCPFLSLLSIFARFCNLFICFCKLRIRFCKLRIRFCKLSRHHLFITVVFFARHALLPNDLIRIQLIHRHGGFAHVFVLLCYHA